MRNSLIMVLAVIAITAGMVAGIIIFSSRPEMPPPISLPAAPATGGVPMEFLRDGIYEKVLTAVERVVQPGRAQVACIARGGAQWICILVDADQRFYELDLGLQPASFPGLLESGFAPPPDPVSRTISIYRSVAKLPMDYQESRGDKILILLCPRAAWPTLNLRWPQ